MPTAAKKSAAKKSTTKKSSAKKASSGSSGFSAAEKAAMKQRSEELRSQGRSGAKKADEAQACLDAIANLSQPDRGIAERIHAIVADVAPQLFPKTWYGFPSYANEDGKVVVFFKFRDKFGTRYANLGFNDSAHLDEGTMWPSEYAITELSQADEKKVAQLVKKAVS